MKVDQVTIYNAAAVRDAWRVDARPGAVAVAGGRVLAVGDPLHVRHRAERARAPIHTVDLPDRLLLPAFVNAHAHLDLTDIGPQPPRDDFAAWIDMITTRRLDPASDTQRAVRRGLAMSWRAGVGWIGDIAFDPAGVRARIDWPEGDPDAPPGAQAIPGVSYVECFGLGSRQEAGFARLEEKLDALPFESPAGMHERGIVLGISPHAPYTVGPDLYRRVARMSQAYAYRVCTHLAESDAELQFTRDLSGPMVELQRRRGWWDDQTDALGGHPINALQSTLRAARWLVVHANYVEDEHIAILKRAKASVVYCPIASDYFGFPTRDGRTHRYRDMLAAGVNVCLGTDSIVCQPADEPQPLGILAQMRHLYRRDSVDPATLLHMATVNGMDAMELDPVDATLQPRSAADIIAVAIDANDETDPLTQVMQSDAMVERVR